ncbi:peptidase M50 [Magnetococcus marinus MC-1]|uniref:Peptidase M50 n=1 Tax=Magnetococcus marinus (strain ATCC BAA-1437 / JCM 17883 / MC-1) TaxID=156889 RepID=A0L9Q6_MAGMM|nr:biotin/lipoyl-binding protein [Magnetococcus marinus]ABK44699.1 peptidase M50 [Magnetococcus marinus MC-1]
MSTSTQQTRVFSDSWHRISGVRVALLSSVRAHRQQFQGEMWVVLRDSLSSDWFRVSTEAYRFLCRLSLQKTVEQAWQESLQAEQAHALTQEEVVQLLGQINLSNLLQYDRTTAGASLFERYNKRRKQERKALWMSFMAVKIPLIDPDSALQRARKLISWLLGPWGVGFYLLLLLAALITLFNQGDRLFDQGAGILAPDNLLLLYGGFIVAKVVHELGHAAVCKHFGGEVHTVGVMLLLFAPLPYVDATASWGFRSRWQRILVGVAGVASELTVAAVAVLVWAYTAPGTLNALAYNVIFASSVSTLLFNINPLLRFDGYHVLVDLLDVPNLFQRSREQLKYLAQRFVLRLPQARPAAHSRREVVLLPLYGVLSLGYWVLLMWSIVFFVAQQYLDFGTALAWFLGFTIVVVPLFKLLRYLLTSPQLERHRGRALGVTAVIVLVVGTVVGGIPMPDRMRVSGVVEAEQFRQLRSESEGALQQLLVQPGSTVQQGQTLLVLSNAQLDLELEMLNAQLVQLHAQELLAISRAVADLAPLQEQRQAVESQLEEVKRLHGALVVRAPLAGVWSLPQEQAGQGRWVVRGGALGVIVQPDHWRFVGVLPQIGTHLFEDQIRVAEVRVRGEEGVNVVAQQAQVVPHENGVLPSAALGMPGGGEIAVDPTDPQGLSAAEPFFRVQAHLPSGAGAHWVHGRLGVMRLTLSDRPLIVQWERALRQFLQRRFRV